MGWRFRKTFTRGPFKTTISKRGIGWSWGVPGFRYGVSPSGRRYISAGVPGSGLYWMKYLDGSSPGPGTPGPGAGGQPPLPPPASAPSAAPGPWWKQKGLGD
jgi:hypothetical protein